MIEIKKTRHEYIIILLVSVWWFKKKIGFPNTLVTCDK